MKSDEPAKAIATPARHDDDGRGTSLQHDRAARIFAEAQYRSARAELTAIKSSAGWRLLQRLYPWRFRLAPRGSRREAAAQSIARAVVSSSTRNRAEPPAPFERHAPAQHPPGPWPGVSIVIVTYNNLELTELCLHALLSETDYPDYTVTVVDNGSTDGTLTHVERVASGESRVHVHALGANRGFAAANNIGASASAGGILCFLNNDTVVHGSWLRALVTHLRMHDDLGLVGPVTNAIDNDARIDVPYDSLEGMRAWADEYAASTAARLEDISMLAFFCVALWRSTWERIGPLDEQFEVGMFEDDDYCRRVRNAGMQVRLARDSFVHHWQGASFRQLSNEDYRRIRMENERRFRAKWPGTSS